MYPWDPYDEETASAQDVIDPPFPKRGERGPDWVYADPTPENGRLPLDTLRPGSDADGIYDDWNGRSGIQMLANASATTPPATSGGDKSGGGDSFGGGFPSSLSKRPSFNFPSPPNFHAPRFSYPDFVAPKPFVAPSGDAVLNEPGYDFRLGQGRKALEQSAAGRGVLRTGGTLKDLIAYGQQFASNEYGNVYNRAKGEYDTTVDNSFRTYGTNYGKSRDIFDREYQASKDEFSPIFTDYQNRFTAEQAAGLEGFGREWAIYNLENAKTEDERAFWRAWASRYGA